MLLAYDYFFSFFYHLFLNDVEIRNTLCWLFLFQLRISFGYSRFELWRILIVTLKLFFENCYLRLKFLSDIVICLEESLLLLVIGVTELLRILLTIMYTEVTEKFWDIDHFCIWVIHILCLYLVLATSDKQFLMYRYINLRLNAEWVIAVWIIHIWVDCSLEVFTLYKWIRLASTFIFVEFRLELLIINLFKTWWRHQKWIHLIAFCSAFRNTRDIIIRHRFQVLLSCEIDQIQMVDHNFLLVPILKYCCFSMIWWLELIIIRCYSYVI